VAEIFNDRVDDWSRSKYLCGFELDYYFGARDSAVVETWQQATAAVDDHVRFAYDIFVHPPMTAMQARWADSLRDEAVRSVDDVSAVLRARKQYLWVGWEAPDSLRHRLGIKD
jgi:hypothetical protein